jgi:UDP-glucose 4-epimerase
LVACLDGVTWKKGYAIVLHDRRVAVVGAGGFIGSHVVDAVLAAGASVKAVDLVLPQGAPKAGATWLIGDVSDEDFVASSMAGCDAVVFLASRSVPASANAQMAAEIRSHVEGSVKAAEIALAQGVKSFIFASSGGTVYGNDSLTPISESSPTVLQNSPWSIIYVS